MENLNIEFQRDLYLKRPGEMRVVFILNGRIPAVFDVSTGQAHTPTGQASLTMDQLQTLHREFLELFRGNWFNVIGFPRGGGPLQPLKRGPVHWVEQAAQSWPTPTKTVTAPVTW